MLLVGQDGENGEVDRIGLKALQRVGDRCARFHKARHSSRSVRGPCAIHGCPRPLRHFVNDTVAPAAQACAAYVPAATDIRRGKVTAIFATAHTATASWALSQALGSLAATRAPTVFRRSRGCNDRCSCSVHDGDRRAVISSRAVREEAL